MTLTVPPRLRQVELSDLIRVVEPHTGVRQAVRVQNLEDTLRARGQSRALRLARRLPATDGVLDAVAVDALLLRVHCELQRLAEELQLPRRVADTLRPWARELRERDPAAPVRVVDVGCGLGLVVRWLADTGALGEGVELVGVDFNDILTGYAADLAAHQGLRCDFVAGDAFAPGAAVDDPSRTVVISTGVLHHLDPADLGEFFAAQQRLGVHAFAHWDIDPSRWADLGAWMFHRARMREPLARHDGVLSARRAYPGALLEEAARRGAPGYRVACTDGPRWRPSLAQVLRPITGVVAS